MGVAIKGFQGMTQRGDLKSKMDLVRSCKEKTNFKGGSSPGSEEEHPPSCEGKGDALGF